MKWLRTVVLFNKGGVMASPDWANLHSSYIRAIANIENPIGTGKLTLRRKAKLQNGQWKRNGVVALKKQFLSCMTGTEHWDAESDVDLPKAHTPPTLKLYPSLKDYREPVTSTFGGFDFMATAEHGTRVAIEWETGNISSSHRSMNKLTIALRNGIIEVGVLIVPSRDLYEHLTDRVGNIGELSGYLAAWVGTGDPIPRGLLAITVVEHDELTDDVAIPYLKAGQDGRAKEGKAKLKQKRPSKRRTTSS